MHRQLLEFGASLICGIALPPSPLVALWWVRGEVDGLEWFAVGVPYVAGIGLVSKNRAVLIIMLVAALALAFIYGVDLKDVYDLMREGSRTDPELHVGIPEATIAFASALYAIERAGRH